MYYGEELGMRTTDPARIEDVHDPIGKLGWPKEKGRDGERTPMQWDASPEAGFTTSAKPWLAIPPSAATYNVESRKQRSQLDLQHLQTSARAAQNGCRRCATARRRPSTKAIRDVFAFFAESGDRTVLVALNMSDHPHTMAFRLSDKGISGTKLAPLFTSPEPGSESIPLDHVVLPPFGTLVAAVE